jgi:hypothetical protein
LERSSGISYEGMGAKVFPDRYSRREIVRGL